MASLFHSSSDLVEWIRHVRAASQTQKPPFSLIHDYPTQFKSKALNQIGPSLILIPQNLQSSKSMLACVAGDSVGVSVSERAAKPPGGMGVSPRASPLARRARYPNKNRQLRRLNPR